MRPLLLHEPFPLPAYGTLIFAAFLLGILLSVREAGRVGLDRGKILDVAFWTVLAAVVGSRLGYVLSNLEEYRDAWRAGDYFKALRVWEPGGLAFLGGFIGAALAGFVAVRLKRLPARLVADTIAPLVPLGHALGRTGCFLAGCCWGKVCTGPLGVRFPPASLVHTVSVRLGLLGAEAGATEPLHPVQLYEALGELVIFFLLLRIRARKRFHGQVFLSYVALYALLRTITEVFRGDRWEADYVGEPVVVPALNGLLGLEPTAGAFLTWWQLAALILAAAAGTLIVLQLRRRRLSTVER